MMTSTKCCPVLPPMRDSKSSGSLVVEAVVIWKGKEREKERRGREREGEIVDWREV